MDKQEGTSLLSYCVDTFTILIHKHTKTVSLITSRVFTYAV